MINKKKELNATLMEKQQVMWSLILALERTHFPSEVTIAIAQALLSVPKKERKQLQAECEEIEAQLAALPSAVPSVEAETEVS